MTDQRKEPETAEEWETHIFHTCYSDDEVSDDADMPFF